MAISLNSIYAPINDFFLKKYQGGEDNPLLFRFDQYGIKISDEDYDPAAHNVQEVFSDLVNRLPVLAADGATVVFLDKPVDEYYHQLMLKPALPSLPPGVDEATRESLQNTFVSLKNEAIRDYEDTYSQARGGGTGGEAASAPVAELFRLSIPTPANWYDRTNTEVWDTYAVTVTDDPAKAPATPVPAPATLKPLWKLRLNDVQLTQLLPTLASPEPGKPIALVNDLKMRRVGAFPLVRLAAAEPVATAPLAQFAARRNGLLAGNASLGLGAASRLLVARPLGAEPSPALDASARTAVQARFHSSFDRLKLLDKITLTNMIKDVAPTQEVSTSTVRIGFDYCLVRINRGWFSSLFLDNRSWYTPGYQKGELTASPESLTVIPSAMLIVKNLRISANWTGDDLRTSEVATGFGPFNVDANQDARADIGHEGIQIVGWLLQKLPSLPSNDPPP